MPVSDAAKARAEAAFKRKEAQAQEGASAWAEYEAKSLVGYRFTRASAEDRGLTEMLTAVASSRRLRHLA